MRLLPSFPKWIALLCLSAICPSLRAGEIELFYTDFENHLVGDDMLVGVNGWSGNSIGTGSHGIDDELVPGLGKIGFIGFAHPSTNFVTVFRKVDFNPLANAAPVLRFDCFLGIEDSTNGMRDSFFITIRNIAGQVLGNLRFINSGVSSGIFVARLNGTGQQFPTDSTLIRGQLHFLSLEIDFSTNRWSAYLDGITIFTDQAFHGGVRALDLGSIAAEWQIAAGFPSGFGNNFMIFDDWTITAIEAGTDPFVVDGLTLETSGARTLTWIAEPKFTYQIEYSDDLRTWKNDLPGSFMSGFTQTATLSYTDSAALVPGVTRCYRIQRVFQP